MAILIAWATAFLFLTIMGGGIVVWSVCLVTIAAVAAWALIPAGETQPPTRIHLIFLGAMAGILVLVALTLIPLPNTVMNVAGDTVLGTVPYPFLLAQGTYSGLPAQ